jgi:lipid-A-disaccharide synthase
MTASKKHIIIVAGEASGDMHAAGLVEALKHQDPSVVFSGLGGPRMRSQGVEIYLDLTRIAVVGFVEVIKHYKEIKQAFDLILTKIDAIKPAAVILVDYPGFNLRLAKEVRKRKIKIIYYISPQVWAWKEKRVFFIKENVDRMLVLFQFEKDFYARHGVEVDFVGHPLLDALTVTTPKEKFLESHGLSDKRLTVGILPGSRPKEVSTLLPIMVRAAEILNKEFPPIQFLVMQAPTTPRPSLEDILRETPLTYRIIENATYDGINACDLCVVASGTATLETGMLQKPMVIVYKTSFLTWALAKFFIKIDNIGLVNVVAGKRVVPECVQFQATGKRVARELKTILTNELIIADIKIDLKTVKESLGQRGASGRAAELILKEIDPQPGG